MSSGKRFGHRFPSPLGDLLCVVDERGALVNLDFVASKYGAATNDELERSFTRRGFEFEWSADAALHVTEACGRYFSGEQITFDLPLAPVGSDFQQTVWRELVRVGYGQTVSYGELAERIGRPGAARAVGRANATNPIAIVVPCHRVVATNGALTGYAGGVERKQALLEMEGALTLSP